MTYVFLNHQELETATENKQHIGLSRIVATLTGNIVVNKKEEGTLGCYYRDWSMPWNSYS